MSTIALIGLDLAKSIFQLHGEDSQGNVVLKKRLTRAQLAEFFAQLEPCIVAMEAWVSRPAKSPQQAPGHRRRSPTSDSHRT